jgi:hypothetical protein
LTKPAENAHNHTYVDFVEDCTLPTTANTPVKNMPQKCIHQQTPLSAPNLPNKYYLVTPIKVNALKKYLKIYKLAQYLIQGFLHGFKLCYIGPDTASVSPNLKSCDDNPEAVHIKLKIELDSGRVKGPFNVPQSSHKPDWPCAKEKSWSL